LFVNFLFIFLFQHVKLLQFGCRSCSQSVAIVNHRHLFPSLDTNMPGTSWSQSWSESLVCSHIVFNFDLVSLGVNISIKCLFVAQKVVEVFDQFFLLMWSLYIKVAVQAVAIFVVAGTLVEFIWVLVGHYHEFHRLQIAQEVKQSSSLNVTSFGLRIFASALQNFPDPKNVVDSLLDSSGCDHVRYSF